MTLVVGLAFCGTSQAADVTDTVPGHSGVTFEMLLKQIMPDLTKGTDGTWTGTVAALRGTDDKPGVDTPLAFGDVSALTVKEGGHKRLLILTGDSRSDSGFDAVLAAFDDSGPRPKFLDDMDVGGDRFVMFGSPPLLAIASGTDAFIVNSNHFNSNQNYTDETILFLDGAKLHIALSQFTLNAGGCGYEMRQNPVYRVRDDKGARYRALVVSVTQVTTHSDETCDEGTILPKPGSHTYTNIFRWDAKKNAYITHTNAMRHLMSPDE